MADGCLKLNWLESDEFVRSMIDVERRFPLNPFKITDCRTYLFSEFDFLRINEFWPWASAATKDIGDRDIAFVPVCPNSDLYPPEPQQCYVPFSCCVEASTEDYMTRIAGCALGVMNDSISINAEIVLCFPASKKWIVYAERLANIAVLSADNEIVERIATKDWMNIDGVTGVIEREFGNKKDAESFRIALKDSFSQS